MRSEAFLKKRLARFERMHRSIWLKSVDIYNSNSNFRIFGVTENDIGNKEFNLERLKNRIKATNTEIDFFSGLKVEKVMMYSFAANILRSELNWNFKAGKEYVVLGKKEYSSSVITHYYLRDENGIVLIVQKKYLVFQENFHRFNEMDIEKSGIDLHKFECNRVVEKNSNPKIKHYINPIIIDMKKLDVNADSYKWF